MATLRVTPVAAARGGPFETTRTPLRPRPLMVALSVLSVAAVGLIAKLPEAILPIGTDTGMFATYARMTLHGARPYVDFYDIHPPVTLYYWVLVESLAGSDWARTCVGSWGTLAPQPCVGLLAHVLDLALTFAAAGLSYLIARRLKLSPMVGVFAALLVVWFANESMISMEGSTPSKLTMVPGTLAVYAYLRAFPNGRTGWGLVSGAAAVLGVLAKQPALTTLCTVLVALLAGVLRGEPGQRRLLLAFAAGGLIMLMPVLAYLAWIGSLGGFLDQPWTYNLERLVVGYWQTPAGLTAPATRIDRVFGQSAGLLYIGALLGGLALWLGRSSGRQRLLLLWGLFSLGAIAGFREFAQVVPPLALLAALGFGRLWEAAAHDGLGLGRPLASRLGLVLIFGALFVLTSSFQLIELRRAVYERGPGAKPADPELIATYLRQVAPPGPIFVWGNAGQIYALSGREPASRFLIAEFTDGIQPRARLSRQQLMGDLQQHPPAVIVVDPRGNEPGLELSAFPEFEALLRTCYASVPGLPTGWTAYQQTSAGCSG